MQKREEIRAGTVSAERMGNDPVQAVKLWSCPQRLPEPTVEVRGDRKSYHDTQVSEQFMVTKPALQETHAWNMSPDRKEKHKHKSSENKQSNKNDSTLMKEQSKN